MRKISVLLLVTLQFFFVQACSAGPEELDYSNLWMSKTSGTWEIGKDYGYYRVLVTRKTGKDHAQDDVYVQIAKRTVDSNKIERTIKLDTPGYKGYVRDIELVNISGANSVAVHIDIEMKAMDGIVLRDVYLVSPDGKVKTVVQSKYMDIYDD
jgi:hypothetical protein